MIRTVDLATSEVSTLAGSPSAGSADGSGSAAAFAQPNGIAIDSTDSKLYIADNQNKAIRVIDIASKQASEVIFVFQ
jgi:DNA-binding beta-propeller fold protein YncE